MSTNMEYAELIVDWRRVVETLLNEDGYLTMGHSRDYADGEIIHDSYGMGIPFRVIGKANREDALRQFRRMAQLTGTEEDIITPPNHYKFFKLIVAD